VLGYMLGNGREMFPSAVSLVLTDQQHELRHDGRPPHAFLDGHPVVECVASLTRGDTAKADTPVSECAPLARHRLSGRGSTAQ
jgi:hypothetical protein